MKISIILTYKNADKLADLWAFSENDTDFDVDLTEAQRCTLSFAACELRKYLKMLGHDAVISDRSADDSFNIYVSCKNADCTECGFVIEPAAGGMKITGDSRTGALYGCYEFLKMQGIRWYAPGRDYEFVPKVQRALEIPQEKKIYTPSMNRGRGFDFEGVLKESADLWLWMVRNKLNMATYRPNTNKLMKKLGMTYKVGGHIFEKMLDPDNVTADGRSFWEAHRAWYGTPESGAIEKKDALSIQFCMSNEELISYLAKNIIKRLKTEWKYARRIDIWGFDTWGKTCCCPTCARLGNGTDKTLHFISRLREHINKSDLNRKIELVMCSYDGTATMEPPENEIPKNLKENGDLVVFYPITRCYRHDFDDESCSVNHHFDRCLKGWLKKKNVPDIIFGEYYNVSKFEDLPLIFTKRISHDMKYYIKSGVRGITYMHVPLINWGVRAVNHMLYAELSWDENADVLQLLGDYFNTAYKGYAKKAKKAYELIEEGWEDCANLRSWSPDSVLSQLIPQKSDSEPLRLDGHYKDENELITKCLESTKKLEQALEILKEIREDIKNNTTSDIEEKLAMNPAELRALSSSSELSRISDDIRGLLYGIDTMKLTRAVTEYHYKTLKGENTDVLWNEIEALYDKTDSYYMPIGFDNNIAETFCFDALTRIQLRGTINRYRSNRKNKGGKTNAD